jgi:type VI secretion system protein ImpC
MSKTNYLQELFKSRGLDAPPASAEPMIGQGLVPTSRLESEISTDSRFMSALAVLLHNVKPMQDEDNRPRFNRSQVLETVARLDALIQAQVNDILHHETFQKAEAAWRGMEDLVNHTNFQANITIDLLDVSKQELAQDFEKHASSIFSGALFNKVYTQEYDQYGGRPFGVMLGLYDFTASRPDLQWLERMSWVANAAHCPFVASASYKFFDCETLEQLESLKSLDGILNHPRYGKWTELRESESAAYISLTLPRYVLRLPYNPITNPCEELNFTEEAHGDPKKYLWGNAAILFGRNLASAFEQSGWCQSIRGPKGGGRVKGLPVDTFTLRGQSMIQMPLEICIPDFREYEFVRHGFMPLVYRKNEAEATFFSTPSIKRAKRYKDPKDSENAQLVTNLAYTFSITRLGHYIKSIMRDNIGTVADEVYIHQQLNNWLMDYVTAVSNPDDVTLRRFPFKAAQVEVVKRPGEIGWYDCKVSVLPHVQFEGLDVELQLESRLG